jgi:alpha amylase-like protein
MELHASREARRLHRLDDFHFSASGTLLLPDFDAARALAERINAGPETPLGEEGLAIAGEGAPAISSGSKVPVKAWQLHAMGLINEIFHYLCQLYRESRKPSALREALAAAGERLRDPSLETALDRIVGEFPPAAGHGGEGIAALFPTAPEGLETRELILQEALILWLANVNPAFAPGKPLFDDAVLRGSGYRELMEELHRFFEGQPPFGPDDQNLIDMLRSPALAFPDSLQGQLEYIWKRWGYLLTGFRHLHRLLSALDWIREEETPRAGAGARGSVPVPDFIDMQSEEEMFSDDRDWMPRLVLLAKNTHVWLEQLSRKHGRWIQRLDHVPDEELELLKRRGFTGLWLIGVWERSTASATIKRLQGNPEAASSAYSLAQYSAAADLGGAEALRHLKERAWARGIRLASDMVPNHMGIDSRWVIERPDWFLSRDRSPFPSYSFKGPDLSGDARIGIFVEDHYFDRSDAAVVFRRLDRHTGEERFVYHGNDGTHTPWNDTAQLNYLNPEVREAVIGEILRVAREFPVIRFDAAMTLAKRHYQRLWFPQPGTGGAIPSRAEHGLTREQFDALMPREFWREVVDRVAREAPDTLLLAEAFWLMEGYFVRTLGMHRVYNSAFMNMLRDEENAKYRSVIKNTLEFDPEVLRRYVNFMNNPDEEPAVEAFGKGDKYFGICTLMAALPGLPMFGHGQWEGLWEKYGMEFRKPRQDEAADDELIARHEREISPLLRERGLFAGVENFLLYDFFTAEGNVDENVFAFSNGAEGRRALVVYQNKFASTWGWIRTSAAFAVKEEGGKTHLAQSSLGQGLGISAEADRFTCLRELGSGLEFIHSSRDLCQKGLYLELHAYQCRVFLNVREVQDTRDQGYARLHAELGGRGVPSLEQALAELRYRPVHIAFRELASAEMFRRILAARLVERDAQPDPKLLDEVEWKARAVLEAIRQLTGAPGDEATAAQRIRRSVEAMLRLPPVQPPRRLGLLVAWILADGIEAMKPLRMEAGSDTAAMAALGLEGILAEALRGVGGDSGYPVGDFDTISIVLRLGFEWQAGGTTREMAEHLILRLERDAVTRRILGFNEFEGTLFLNKEALEDLVSSLQTIAALQQRMIESPSAPPLASQRADPRLAPRSARLTTVHRALQEVVAAAERAGYRVKDLHQELKRASGRSQ